MRPKLKLVTILLSYIHLAIITQKKDGTFLSFEEQIKLYTSLDDWGPECFPQDLYSARNATSDESLEATKELLHIKEEKLTPFQLKVKGLGNKTPLGLVQSRFSNYFLQKHKQLME